jgi:NitT/TauT family transport system substrate-binding protein
MGIRFVANSVVTTRKMLEEHPETVKNFTKALLQGWHEILEPSRLSANSCRPHAS